jgi:hypothetical protein
VVSSAQVSTSTTPVLGNLQSVVGSGMGNAITTSSVVTMSSHSPLTTALQSGNSSTQSSSNTIGTQVKGSSTTATTTVPHEVQAQVILLELEYYMRCSLHSKVKNLIPGSVSCSMIILP